MPRVITTMRVLSWACPPLSRTLLWPTALTAQAVGERCDIAPGVVRKPLGDYPSNVPGFEHVRIVEDTLPPGATVGPESLPVPLGGTALTGEATRSVDGKEQQLKTGDS